MRNVFTAAIVCLGFLGACASPPPADPESADVTCRVKFAAASLEVGGAATLPVEQFLAGPHPVDFYVRLALERNPEILAARRGVAGRAEVIPQVTALDDPMLVDSFQPVTSNSVQTAAGRGTNMLTLSQRFPWFGKLRLRGEVAEQETKMALTRLAQSQLKVIENVKLSYYELYFIQRAIEITEEDAKLLSRLLKSADARYRTGKTSFQDVLRGQVELEKLANRLIVLRRRLAQAKADLAKDLHTSPEADFQANSIAADSAPQQIEHLYAAAVRCRPELQERLHAIVRDQRMQELARLNYYPDVTLGLGWQAITANNALSGIANGNDNFAITVGINLPVWRDKLQAGLRESEHRLVESARRYDAERDDTFRRIKRLIVQAHALEQQIELFEKSIVPKAERTLRISATDYSVGKVDFQQVIDNWTGLLQFQVQVVRLKASLGQTLASLERVIGCQLVTFDDGGETPVPPAPEQPPDDRKPAAGTPEKSPAKATETHVPSE